MNPRNVENVKQKSGNSGAEIFEALHTALHVIRSRQFQIFKHCPYELTQMEGKILAFFARHPNARLSDLAAHTGRDKGQLAQIVKTLRGHDLLAASDDPNDRRSVRLNVTKEGAKIHRVLEEELAEITDLSVRNLSARDRTELLRLLNQLRANVETK